MTSMAAIKAALNRPGQQDAFDGRLPEVLHEQFRADPAGLAAALAHEAYVRSAIGDDMTNMKMLKRSLNFIYDITY